jgi:hypothetical protein
VHINDVPNGELVNDCTAWNNTSLEFFSKAPFFVAFCSAPVMLIIEFYIHRFYIASRPGTVADNPAQIRVILISWPWHCHPKSGEPEMHKGAHP